MVCATACDTRRLDRCWPRLPPCSLDADLDPASGLPELCVPMVLSLSLALPASLSASTSAANERLRSRMPLLRLLRLCGTPPGLVL